MNRFADWWESIDEASAVLKPPVGSGMDRGHAQWTRPSIKRERFDAPATTGSRIARACLLSILAFVLGVAAVHFW